MSSPVTPRGPPYAPRYAGLGGTPRVVPDVPVSAVFLTLYLIFGIIHLRIFKKNKDRGHKFMFNGAMLGLCKIRIMTMSVRIAWTCYPKSVGLGIAAGVFVYVGIIIIYIVNWFFAQRIVRAQHPEIGWTTAYRVFHRGAIVGLISVLILLIVGSITPFFTLDPEKLRIFRIFIKLGQTYFTIFCLAPAIVVGTSLIVPRTNVEKFGAGRLKVKIVILLAAVTVVSTGQVFRCVLAWIEPTPLHDAHGQPVEAPWYLEKACFYVFNFVTELIVVIMFALTRIDLRFHVPNGAKAAGDYTVRESEYPESQNESKKVILEPPVFMMQQNNSSETLYKYKSTIFEDTHILADSLRFASSTMEIDEITGTCKIKRASGCSTISARSGHSSGSSLSPEQSTTLSSNVQTIPEDSAPWPLPERSSLRCTTACPEPSNSTSRNETLNWLYDIEKRHPDDSNTGDEIENTVAPLKRDSKQHKRQSSQNSGAQIECYKPTSPVSNEKRSSSNSVKRTTSWQNSVLHVPQRLNEEAHNSSSGRSTPTLFEMPRVPETDITHLPEAHTRLTTRRSSGSLRIISLGAGPHRVSHRVLDVSLQGDQARTVTPSETGKEQASSPITQDSSVRNSTVTTDSDAREYATAQDEFRRFSFEAVSISPVQENSPYQTAR